VSTWQPCTSTCALRLHLSPRAACAHCSWAACPCSLQPHPRPRARFSSRAQPGPHGGCNYYINTDLCDGRMITYLRYEPLPHALHHSLNLPARRSVARHLVSLQRCSWRGHNGTVVVSVQQVCVAASRKGIHPLSLQPTLILSGAAAPHSALLAAPATSCEHHCGRC
jgi:hypothetical protein